MKKLFVLFISTIVPTIICAQSFDTSTDFEKTNELLSKGLITYSDIPKDYLTGYFNWMQMYSWSRDGGKTYKGFYEYFSTVWNTPQFNNDCRDIEIEDNSNIYTYPVAYSNIPSRYTGGIIEKGERKADSYDEPGTIVFYSTQITPEESDASYVSIHGRHYPAVAAYMDKIKIGKHTEDLWTCFGDINTADAQIMTPVHFCSMYGNYVIALEVTYSDTPEIIYTPPKYEIVAGQLMEIDNGVHYIVPLYDVGYLAFLNPVEMRSKILAIKGISYPGLKYSGQHLIYYDSNSYPGNTRNSDETISMNGTPIYFIKIEQDVDGIEFQITPADGDVILDIQETSKYILLCGTNKKQGYVGYDNPTLIIIDKDTKKEIARYRSKRKDRYFTKMLTLDENNLYIQFDDYASTSFNDGRGPEHFEVVNIPSILQQELN